MGAESEAEADVTCPDEALRRLRRSLLRLAELGPRQQTCPAPPTASPPPAAPTPAAPPRRRPADNLADFLGLQD